MQESKVKSLEKALKLLDFFTPQRPELGITELSNLSGLLKSSVHNMVSTFEVCGYLEKNIVTGKYRLGKRILILSNSLYSSNDVRLIVRPYMEKLSAQFGETVYFAQYMDGVVVYLDAVFTAQNMSSRQIIGMTAPMYCTGVGKAILAFLSKEQIQQVIDSGLIGFTEQTITTKDKLLKEFEVIRKNGYAIDNMEHEFGIKCVAAPIFNSTGKIVAALSLSGPSLRFSQERITELAGAIVAYSKEISKLIL